MASNNYKHWKLETDTNNILWCTLDKNDASTNVLSAEVMKEFANVLHQIALRGARTQDGGIRNRRAVVAKDGAVENRAEADHGDQSVASLLELERDRSNDWDQDRHRSPARSGCKRGQTGDQKHETRQKNERDVFGQQRHQKNIGVQSIRTVLQRPCKGQYQTGDDALDDPLPKTSHRSIEGKLDQKTRTEYRQAETE